ncbi:Vacuolar protein sorting-associated protein 41, partial [Linderina macrospora]
FAKEQNDPELWNDLLMYSRDKPEFILGLLELGGTHINPTKLIRNIPSELSVPGIRRALTNVLHDYHLQVELCTDCKHVLNGDVDVLSDGLRHMQHQGLDIENDQMCLVCQLPLEDLPRGSAVLAFWCGHIFHDKCILHPDVLAKTQMHNSAESSTLSLSSSRRQITVHSRRDQRRMMLQTKLDRSMLIKQYNPVCPVCAEYDQKKVQQTTTGWSQSERRDHLDDPETEAGGSSAEKSELFLPPMQTLQL